MAAAARAGAGPSVADATRVGDSEVNRRRRGVWLFTAGAMMLGLALWLFTLDVYADDGRRYAGESQADGTPSFCGSAYDVALIRGDGFMGGEVPENQDVLNQQCVTKAARSVAVATAAAVDGTLSLLWGVGATRRGRSVPGEAHDTVAATTA